MVTQPDQARGLSNRRERLLSLAGPDGPTSANLLVTEPSEQLIVADEELRVQREELAAARRQLTSISDTLTAPRR